MQSICLAIYEIRSIWLNADVTILIGVRPDKTFQC
jgi:hypothetical protein